jgi:hypothetical protein
MMRILGVCVWWTVRLLDFDLKWSLSGIEFDEISTICGSISSSSKLTGIISIVLLLFTANRIGFRCFEDPLEEPSNALLYDWSAPESCPELDPCL